MNSADCTILKDVSGLETDDLAAEYEKLAKCHQILKNDYENLFQTIHELKRNNKSLKLAQDDVQNELETISSIHAKEFDEQMIKMNATVEELKEKNHKLSKEREFFETKVEELTPQVHEMKLEISELKSKLIEVKPRPRISSGTHSSAVEIENENLQAMVNILQEKIETTTYQITSHETKIDEQKEIIMCLTDCLESKKTELAEKLESIDSLQNRIIELNMEIAICNNTPEDANRKGNSLFAEVDDQRQKMKAVLKGQKAHYHEMKKSCNAKEIEIRRLKREKTNIKQEIQACSNLFKHSENLMIQSLKTSVLQLKKENSNLEGLLFTSEKNLIDLAKSMKIDWVESLLETANNETRELKERLYALMVQKSSLDDNFYKIEKELAKARLDKIKLKILLGRIVEENNIDISQSNFTDLDIEPEVLENLKQEKIETLEYSPDIKHKMALGPTNIHNETSSNSLSRYDLKATNIEDKENELKQALKQELPSQLNAIALKSPLKQVQKAPATEDKIDSIRAVKFSELVETKTIDRTNEQLEQSKESRKKHGVVVKRIVIPSKLPRSAQD